MAKTRKRAKTEASDDGADANVDQVVGELERVVAELEGGELSLEDSLERFERGVALARTGERLLSSVERRVEMLLAERDEVVPFDAGDADE